MSVVLDTEVGLAVHQQDVSKHSHWNQVSTSKHAHWSCSPEQSMLTVCLQILLPVDQPAHQPVFQAYVASCACAEHPLMMAVDASSACAQHSLTIAAKLE